MAPYEEDREQALNGILDDLDREEQERTEMRQQSYEMLNKSSPDDAAEALRLGEKFGVPRQAVEADPEAWKQREEKARTRLLREASPRTMAWFDDADNHAVAKDEMDLWGSVEDFWWKGVADPVGTLSGAGKNILNAGRAGFMSAESSLADMDREQLEKASRYYEEYDAWSAREAERKAQGKGGFVNRLGFNAVDVGTLRLQLPGDTDPMPRPTTRLLQEAAKRDRNWYQQTFNLPGESYRGSVRDIALAARPLIEQKMDEAIRVSKAKNKAVEDAMPQTGDFLADSLLGGVRAITEMSPLIVSAIATRGKTVPALVMGGQVYYNEYATGREADLSIDDSTNRALLQAGVETISERISLGIIDDMLKSDKSLVRRFAGGMLGEQVQEQAATLGNRLVDWNYLTPEMTLGEFVAETPRYMVQTALTTMVASAGMQTTFLAADYATRRLLDDTLFTKPTNGDAAIDAVLDKMSESKLRKRAPKKAESLASRIAADQGDTIVVDVDGLAQDVAAAGGDLNQVLQDIGIDPAAVSEGESALGRVEVSAAKLLTSEGMQTHRDAVRPHIVFKGDAFGLTPREKEGVDQTMVKLAERSSEYLREEFGKAGDFAIQIDDLEQTIKARLEAANFGDTAEVNTVNARAGALIVAAMAKMRAEKTGEEMELGAFFEAFGPRILGVDGTVSEDAALTGQDVLPQAQSAGYEGQDKGEAASWLRGVEKFGPEGMTTEARMARAKEMGFDTETVLYHGSSKEFDAFREGDRGIFFGAKETASDYGEAKAYYVRGKMAPRSVVVQVKKDIKADREKSVFSRFENERPHQQRELVRRLRALGYDGYSQGMGIPGALGETVIFDPANIRSVHAAFDPDQSDSADLLGQELSSAEMQTLDAETQEAITDPETDVLPLTDDMQVMDLDEFIAFHGTLAKFDKFEMDKMGSGEGAQAFGPGHYFTQSKGVAEWYRKRMKTLSPGIRMGKEPFNKADPVHFALSEYWRWANPEKMSDVFGTNAFGRNFGHQAALEQAISVLEYDRANLWQAWVSARYVLPTSYNAAIRDQEEVSAFLDAAIAHLKTINPKSSRGVPRPSKSALRGGGNIYTVAVKLPADATIQLDLTFGEQPEKVKAAFLEAAEQGHLGEAGAALEKYGDATRMSVLVAALKTLKSSAMEIMRANGIRGVRYLDGMSRGKKNKAGQTYNYVVFNDSDVKVLDREGKLFQMMEQERRGSFSPSTRMMTFTEARDASSFMHEMSHWFLGTLENLSETEAWAGEELAEIDRWYQSIRNGDQMKAIRARYSVVEEMGGFRVMYQGQPLELAGTPEEAEAKIEWRERHEAWAETFEQYLQTGKAPTPKLVSMFARFRDWLMQIYRSLLPGERANLTPEIRDYFDRIMMVDAEIDAAAAESFRDADDMAKKMLEDGIITERQYRMVGERLNKAKEEVKAEWIAEALKQEARTREEWWKTERARMRGDIARAFDRSKAGRMYNWLAYGQWKGDVPFSEAPGDVSEVEFFQSIRTAARMPMAEVDAWVRANITAEESTFPNGDTLTVVRFPLTDDEGAPEVMLSIRMKADGKQSGRADVNLFLDNQMADAMEGVEDVAQRGRMAMEMFGKAVLVMRKYAVEYDPRAFSFVAAESQAEGTKAKSREDLYRYMLSSMKMEGYTAYEVESMTSVVNEIDGAKSANPMFPSAGFMLVKDGENVEDFARNEILRGNQRGGGAGEVVTVLKATRLTPDLDASGRRMDRRGSRAGAADTGGAVDDTLGQSPLTPDNYKPVEEIASADDSFAFARSQPFATNRELKVEMQRRVESAAEDNNADLSDEDYLVRMTERDARSALIGNANAVGWYDEKVRKSITALTLLHPELETDVEARFAFTWALAVTSNGLKVDKNFELAETVYSAWKASSADGASRRMPTNVGIGTAAKAINKSLGLYNTLVEKHGVQVVLEFMTARQTVKQVQAFTGENVSGENLTTEVFGAAALGPKIGNGFFMNLYGEFGQLTMDRWLMRTWGRWSATLITDYKKQIKETRTKLAGLVKLLSPADKRALEKIIRRPIKLREIDEVAFAIQKASQKPALREQMNKLGLFDDAVEVAVNNILGDPAKGSDRNALGAEIRKSGNNLFKYLDGQKEQPSGPPERAKIRKVFARALENMKKDYPALTMADLQALLWYPEKRLYDTAKAKEGEETEGYEDDEAPDYANAARNLVVSKGVSETAVRDAYARIDADVQAARRAGRVERESAGRSGRGGTQGLADGALQDDTLGQEAAPAFYSALGRFVSRSGTARAPAAQWKGMIQNAPGVKAEEVEWTGVLDWLDASEGPVTREALAAFVEANGVRVEEVRKGASDPAVDRQLERELLALIEERDRLRRDWNQIWERSQDMEAGSPEVVEAIRESQDLDEQIDALTNQIDGLEMLIGAESMDTKWSSWTLPGGENYREMLLTLPVTREQRADMLSRNEDGEQLIDLEDVDPGVTGKPDQPAFRSSHWAEPNVLAHVRFKERTGPNGERVLAVEEIQSDWHQAGRERGYADAESKAAVDKATADGIAARTEMIAALTDPSVVEKINARGTSSEKEMLGMVQRGMHVTDQHLRSILINFFRDPSLPDGVGDRMNAAIEAYEASDAAYRTAKRAMQSAIPNAPFKNNAWANLVLKRMIRYAAENGFDAVAWIPGNIQNGRVVEADDNRGDFYDKIVPNAANKLGKKYGARVEKKTFDIPEFAFGLGLHTFPITPELAAAAMTEGFPLFQPGDPKGWGETAPPPDMEPMRLDLRAVEEMYGKDVVGKLPAAVRKRSSVKGNLDDLTSIAEATRKTLKQKGPQSLVDFIRRRRVLQQDGSKRLRKWGIKGAADELKAMGLENLINEKSGMDIDYVREAAEEAGFIQAQGPDQPSTINDLLAALDREARGEKVYRADAIKETEEQKSAEMWAEWFRDRDINIFELEGKALRAALARVAGEMDNTLVTPDQAAEKFGFEDGKALIEALIEVGNRDKYLNQKADEAMVAEFGDMMKDGTLQREAEEAARLSIHGRQNELELEALARAVGVQAAGNYARAQARQIIAMRTVKEIAAYENDLRAERRFGKIALQAVQKGDMQGALRAKQKQLVAAALYTEGKKAHEKIEKTRQHLRTYETSETKRSRLAKAGHTYLEQMDDLLSRYRLRKEGPKAIRSMESLHAWATQELAKLDPLKHVQPFKEENQSDSEEAEADPLDRLAEITRDQQIAAEEDLAKSRTLERLAEESAGTSYQRLTFDEFMAVREQADMIYNLAKVKTNLMAQGDKRDFQKALGEIVDSILTNKEKDARQDPLETDLPAERTQRAFRDYMDAHRTLLSLFRQMDGGKDNGPLQMILGGRLSTAFGDRAALWREMEEGLAKLFEVYQGADRRGLFGTKVHVPEVGITMTKQGILAVALNMGTQKNRQRMMDSEGWSEADLYAIVDSLDQRDWQFVQDTWSFLDSWFPRANEVHTRVHGLPMDKAPAAEVVTKYGVLKGGYYPIVFDSVRSSKTAQRQLEKDAAAQAGRVGARSRAGFTKKRSEGKVAIPLRYSVLDVLVNHLSDVADSIALQEPLMDVGRIAVHPQFEAAIKQKYGGGVYRQILLALREAKQGQEVARNVIEKGLVHLRNGTTTVGLGWRFSTAALQVFGLSNSVVRVGGYWIAKGLARVGTSALSLQNAGGFATERSSMMANRVNSQQREIADLRNKFKGERVPSWVKESFFWMITTSQFYAVDLPTWLGQYEKSMANGATEAEAIIQADLAVQEAQGTGEIYGLAGIQRGSPLLKLFTNFLSYMVTTYNLAAQRTANTNFRNPAKAAAWATDMVLLLTFPVITKMMLDAALKGAGPDDDEDETWMGLYFKEQMAFLMSMNFFTSQVTGMVTGYSFDGPTGTAALKDIEKTGTELIQAANDEDQSVMDAYRPALRAAGAIFHVPTGQLDTSIMGLRGIMEGESDDYSDILFGPDQETREALSNQ